MKYSFLALCLCLITLASSAAADSLALTFTDDAGNPIAGVAINYSWTAQSPATPGNGSAISDNSGKAVIAHPGSGSCRFIGPLSFNVNKTGWIFSHSSGGLACGTAEFSRKVLGIATRPMRALSAAHYVPGMANEMIQAAFGTNLANVTLVASLPLPTSLGQRSVIVVGEDGVARQALLLFVSPQQINFIAPGGIPPGDCIVKVVDSSGATVSAATEPVTTIAPGVFTANADGQGVPAAVIVRVRPNGAQVYEPLVQFDPGLQKYVPLLINLGPENEVVVLALFGTGWRNLSSNTFVWAEVDGIRCPIEYIGKQPSVAGLDQMNIRLPRELAGKGTINLGIYFLGGSVSSNPSNTPVLKIL